MQDEINRGIKWLEGAASAFIVLGIVAIAGPCLLGLFMMPGGVQFLLSAAMFAGPGLLLLFAGLCLKAFALHLKLKALTADSLHRAVYAAERYLMKLESGR